MTLRSKPHQMVSTTQAPFGEHLTYFTTDPLQAILADATSYFLNSRSQMYAGDTVRVVQVLHPRPRDRSNRVVAFADLLVVEATEQTIQFDVLRAPKFIPQSNEPETAPTEPPPEVYVTADCEVKHKGRGKWAVIHPEKGEIAVVDGKEAAEEIAKGNVPVPEAA